MEIDATLWAFFALVVFLALVGYLGIPKRITKILDDKAGAIARDLDEAKRLREEAKALLAEYQRKRQAAENEAREIIAEAEQDAARLAREAEVSLEKLIARRTKAVEEKIARAEAQAITDIRALSADIAIDAAKIVLTDKMDSKGDTLITQAVKDVSSGLSRKTQ